ncbi:phage baseplate protein [Azotobacter salinestris]|uniref:phage baseplate protein n=1 Tax=Azotobacter salinestris TaxID=69964 RepID=UPI001266C3CC|nr:hypothetical protein [Azotobacter salinestris]
MAQTDPRVIEATQDLVAILDAQTFQPVLSPLAPMRVTVREVSRLTTWPVEDGTERTDHRVIQPVEIELPALLTESVRDQFELLRQAYMAGTEVIVQTRVRSYPRMMIMEIPHDETPDQMDALAVAVRLREIQTVEVQFGTLPPRKVAGPTGNPAQTDTVRKGSQQTTPSDATTQRRASVLYGIFN